MIDADAAVAIVGIACRVPGAADAEQLWRMLRDGRDAIVDLDDAVLAAGGVSAETRSDPTYVRARGNIAGVAEFDAALFGYTPAEAALMDPQQRIFLQAAWHALEDAGAEPDGPAQRTGVFAGAGLNGYLLHNVSSDRELIANTDYHQLLLASEKDFLATRVSYKLGLTGPSVTVATACSTSLVAVHAAARSILDGECELALAGGVAIPVPLERGFAAKADGVLSPSGRCRPFSAQADGIGVGSGVVVVVLEQVARARARGGRIYAVIRGSAVNNDGSAKVGFTAPGLAGQVAVERAALAAAGIDAASIGYVEAHGTGTPLGDPIEIAALAAAYGTAGVRDAETCAIGSIKGNIGHLDVAAGAAGLVKAALALHFEEIPPTLHAQPPNPAIDFGAGSFFLSTALRRWPRGDRPRRAAVSSFGLGGTNAHVVLEEAPPAPTVAANVRAHHVLTVSARTDAGAERGLTELLSHLRDHPEVAAADAAFTLAGRRRFAERRAVIWPPGESPAIVSGRAAAGRGRPVCFVFPGGGSEYAGMGRELYAAEPVFRAEIDRCGAILARDHGVDLDAAIGSRAASAEAAVHAPRLALPALFAVESALARQWLSWGVVPDAMLGHSLGEYVAAYLAGVFTLDDALGLVALRGALLERTPPGAMLRVGLDEAELRPLLGERLSIAAVNLPSTCVISGGTEDVERFEASARERGIDCRRLRIAAAAHSALVEPLLDEFARYLDGIELAVPQRRWISNVTGDWIAPREATNPGYWCRHFRQTVRFGDGLARALADPDRIVIEVGPGRTLASLAVRHPAYGPGHAALSSLGYREEERPADVTLLEALAGAWVTGVEPDAGAFSAGRQHVVSVPGYSFEREVHWIGPRVARGEDMESHEPRPTRRTSSLARIKEIVSKVSGLPPERIDGGRTFFELGLDSLALIQVNEGLRKQLDVHLGLGDLIERFAQLDALAAHVDALQPADPPPLPAPVAPAAAPPAAAPPSAGIEALVAGQLEIMRAQLELLRGLPAAAAPVALPAPPPKPAAPARPPLGFSTNGEAQRAELSPLAQRHVDALIARYTARTRRSKEYAGTYRGVLSDSRAAVGFKRSIKEMQYPIVGERGAGSRFWDVDGNEYVDLTNGFGVVLFGHHPPFLERALAEHARSAFLLGPRSPQAGEVARLIAEFTGMDRVAFCNSGTEAVMAAIRLARTRTGRSRIVTFAGAYHGHSDQTLVHSAWRDGLPVTEPIAPGIPPAVVAETTVLEYGTPEALAYVRAHAAELAAVLVEPIQNMRLDFAPVDFLRELRDLTATAGAALIFDEMITGFRLHPAGAQGYYGIAADIATYGKVIGGGMPIGVVAGRAEYLDGIDGGAWSYGDDSGPTATRTFFGGTFCQHPLAMIAAEATLRELRRAGPALQERLNERTADLARRLDAVFRRRNVPIRILHFGSAFRFVVPSSLDLFFYHLIENGIYVWEWRGCFLTTAHTDADIDAVVDAVERSLDALAAGGFLEDAPAGDAPVPLTRAQRQLVALARLDRGGLLAYTMGVSVLVRGQLDRGRLARALAALIARHEALRTVVDPDGAHQRVLAALDVPLGFADFSDAAGAEQERRVDAWFARKNATPLDLEAGPLVACDLLRLAQDAHVVVFTAHHLVSDGWSFTNAVGELFELYRGETLAAPMQYREYVAWQQAFARGEAYARQRDYWLGRFAGGVPALELPVDRPRPTERTYRAGRATVRIARDVTARLRTVAAEQRCTLFIALYAAYAAVLERFTDQAELLIGISTSGRGLENADALFGYCTHVLPVRVAVERDDPFTTHLARTKATLAEAYANADYPFADLLDALELRADRSRAPFVSATFNLDRPVALPAADGLALEFFRHPVSFADLDLAINVIDLDGELIVDCDYNADLFDAATAERIAGAYAAFLGAVAGGPDRPLGEIPLGLELGGPPPAASAASPFVPVHVRIEERAAARPDGIAVICDGESVSYAELNARANRLARALQRRGAAPQALVAIHLEPSIELVVAVLAVLKAGAAYLPIDVTNPPARTAAILADAGPIAVVSRAEHAPALAESAERCILLDRDGAAIAAEDAAPPGVRVEPGDLAYAIYTSGSTGKPKGVLVEHGNVARLLAVTEPLFDFGPDDVWTFFHSVAFDFSVWEIFGCLVHGGRLVVVPYWVARDATAFVRLLERERVTVLNQTPSAFRQVIAADAELAPALALRTVIFGGEALDATSLRPWFARHGDRTPALVNMYGITETTVHVTYRRLERDDADGGGGIGLPLPDLRVVLVDARLRPVPRGAAGEIAVGGAGVARGYLNDAERTAQRFVRLDGFPGERFYRSGDRARWTNDGELAFLGRIDDQVKLRGYRIELGEIESALRAQPGVDDAVAALRGPHDARRIVAYVVSRATPVPPAAGLREQLAALLPDYMIPSAFVALEHLPLTRSGKVDRNALPEPAQAAGADGGGRPPQTANETLLAAVWSGVLGHDVGCDDDFFEAGGDSIVAMQIVGRAAVAGLALSLRDVLRHPTVAAQARLARNAAAETSTADAGGAALLPAQRWFFARDVVDAGHETMTIVLDVAADTDPERLARALDAVADRHPALRTGFRRGAAGWEPSVQPAPVRVPLSVRDRGELTAARTALQAELRLDAPPLWRALLGTEDGAPAKLLLAFHHLIVDGVSLRIILDDLEAAYAAAAAGRAPALPPAGTAPERWAAALEQRVNAGDFDPQVAGRRVTATAALPTDGPGRGAGLVGDERHERIRFEREESAALLALPARPDDVLLAAVAVALGAWLGPRRILVDCEGHGREGLVDGLDVTRTVGWFTSIVPVELELRAPDDANAALARAAAARASASAFGAARFATRWLHRDDARRSALAAPAEILFNYLGQLNVGGTTGFIRGIAPESAGPERSPRNARSHALEINAYLADSRLELDVAYAATVHAAGTIATFASGLADAVRTLVASPARVDSDLDPDEMERIFSALRTR